MKCLLRFLKYLFSFFFPQSGLVEWNTPCHIGHGSRKRADANWRKHNHLFVKITMKSLAHLKSMCAFLLLAYKTTSNGCHLAAFHLSYCVSECSLWKKGSCTRQNSISVIVVFVLLRSRPALVWWRQRRRAFFTIENQFCPTTINTHTYKHSHPISESQSCNTNYIYIDFTVSAAHSVTAISLMLSQKLVVFQFQIYIYNWGP